VAGVTDVAPTLTHPRASREGHPHLRADQSPGRLALPVALLCRLRGSGRIGSALVVASAAGVDRAGDRLPADLVELFWRGAGPRSADVPASGQAHGNGILWLGGGCQWWMSSTPRGRETEPHPVSRTLSRVSIKRLFSNWGRGQWLVATAVILAIATVIVGVADDLLAAAILQAVTLVFGVYGSYVLGQVSARQAAQDLVRPHARSAFRRMLNLYAALGRLHEAVGQQLTWLSSLEGMHDKTVNFEHVRASLMLLEAVVIEQIATGEDAIEDWRDLVPDEVAEIERKARERGEDV
jgi:hypothetical protein